MSGWGEYIIERSLAEDLGVLGDEKVNMRHELNTCVLTAQQANGILSCIKR